MFCLKIFGKKLISQKLLILCIEDDYYNVEHASKPEAVVLGAAQTEDVDTDVIESCIGQLGKWNIIMTFVISLAKIPVAWHVLGIVFLAPPPGEVRCINNTTDICSPECPEIIYDTSTFSSTIITEWNLICDRKYLAQATQAVCMFGMLIGNLIFGDMGDRYGRHPALVLGIIIQSIAGTVAAFASWFWLFLLAKFITSMATGGTMIIASVFVMEMIGGKWRTIFGTLSHVPLTVGCLMMVAISYYIRNWRQFEIAISAPIIILVAYYWLLPESPRWQLAVGKREEAMKTLKAIATFNNLPVDHIEQYVEEYYNKKKKNSDEGGGEGIIDLFRSKIARSYTILIWFQWLVCGFCFYGVSQYSGHLGGNIFISVLLSSFSQLPGILFTCYASEAWGRRRTVVVNHFLSGISLITLGFVPVEFFWIRTTIAMFATFTIVLSFATSYIFSTELFPTRIRNAGVGSSSMFARVGSIVAPFAATISSDKKWLSPVILGSTAIVGALFCLKLPETLGCKLPETVQDVEQLKRRTRKSV